MRRELLTTRGALRWSPVALLAPAAALVIGSSSAQSSAPAGQSTNASADPIPARTLEYRLRTLARSRRLDRELRLVLGPLQAGLMPVGTVLSARFDGRVSGAYTLAPPATAAGTSPTRLGATSHTVRTAGSLQIILPLANRARDGLRSAHKLTGTLSLTAVVGAARATTERKITVYPLKPPRCFGAASRDSEQRCENAALRLLVMPTPLDALISPNTFCTPVQEQTPRVCRFSARAKPGAQSVALIGDSHAGHWRGAVRYVADHEGWEAVSTTHAGCPLRDYSAGPPSDKRSSCARWTAAVNDWLRRHPEVRTLFVSQNVGGEARLEPGTDRFAAAVREYAKAWRALPASVRQVIVIRDVPRNAESTFDCVQRARARRRPAGPECAVPRGEALPPDPAATAVRRLRPERVALVDLTRYFCTTRSCPPVIGGALVHKDRDHITDVYARTLGPFLRRHVRRLLNNRR